MATSTAQNSAPVFVPATVRASERRATQIAERAVAPGGFVSSFIRSRQPSLSGRAITFANRILGGWLGARSVSAETDAQSDATPADAWSALAAPRQADGAIIAGPTATSFRGSNIPMVTLSLPSPVKPSRTRADFSASNELDSLGKQDVLVREILRPTPAPVAEPVTRPIFMQSANFASSTPAASLSPSLQWVEAHVAKVAPTMVVSNKVNDVVAPNPGYVWLAPATRIVHRGAEQPQSFSPIEDAPLAPVASTRPQVAAMPELRFEAGIAASGPVILPQRSISSSRVDQFVDTLSGVRAERDASPQTVMSAEPTTISYEIAPAASVSIAKTVASPELSYVAPAMLRKAPMARTELFRPGSVSAQTEMVAPALQSKVDAMWTAPQTQVSDGATQSGLQPVHAVQVPTSHAAGQPVASSAPIAVSRVWNAPALSLPMIAPSDRAQSARGLRGMNIFVGALQGLEIARQVAPRTVEAFDQVVVAPAVVSTKQNRTTTSAPAVATFAANQNAVGSPGEIGVRTEQFAGAVGVRAAGVAVDFVDPAKWAEFAVQTAAARTVAPVYVMPASQRPVATSSQVELQPQSAPASRAVSSVMSRADWALIATFPTQQTMDQLAAMKQVENTLETNDVYRSTSSFSPAYVSNATPVRGARLQSGRIDQSANLNSLISSNTTSDGSNVGSVAAVNQSTATSSPRAMPEMTVVAPTVTPMDRVSLPGGVRPRGAFLWPKATEVAAAPTERAATSATISGITTPVVTERGQAKSARGNAPVLQVLEGGNAAQTPAAAPTPARASLERMSKPLLELVRGGAETASRDEAVRQLIAPQQATTNLGDSGARVVEAAQKPLVGQVGSDDRLTLGDLTLVSFAAATEQVAASSKGGAPAHHAAPLPAANTKADKPTEADTEEWARAVLALIDSEKRSDWERGDF